MSMVRSASRPAVFRNRTLVVLSCLLVAGCASAGRTGTAQVSAAGAVDWLNTT